jgi:hypothetical protein
MSEHPGDGPHETPTIGGECFDFSALAQFDAGSVPVITTQLSGVVCAGPCERPLGSPLGESCGEANCHYRAYELTLHESPHALLSGFAQAAAEISAPLELVIDGMAIDVYRVRAARQTRIVDLEHHPIRHKLGLSAERLGTRPIDSPEWELVRSLRDLRRTQAIRFAGAPGPQRLVIHEDLARELSLERLGTLCEVLPIVPAGVGTGSFAGSIARLLRRSSE